MPPPAIDEAAARVQAGCPTGQEPVFRAGSASERNDLPVRNARFPIRASRTLRRLAYSGYAAGKRERKERERDEVPPGAVSIRRRTAPSGDRTGNEAGERTERPRVRLGLAEPGSEEGSCDRFLGCADRSFPAETQDEPGISAKPDCTLCYTSRSRRCFRLILPDGWKPSGMEPAGKCLHLAHSVY